MLADNISLCDTEWSDEYIFNILKDRIHSNMRRLNVVILVISASRLQKFILNNIKK